ARIQFCRSLHQFGPGIAGLQREAAGETFLRAHLERVIPRESSAENGAQAAELRERLEELRARHCAPLKAAADKIRQAEERVGDGLRQEVDGCLVAHRRLA